MIFDIIKTNNFINFTKKFIFNFIIVCKFNVCFYTTQDKNNLLQMSQNYHFHYTYYNRVKLG